MDEEFLDYFIIEEIEERDALISESKIYFNPGIGDVYFEGWHS